MEIEHFYFNVFLKYGKISTDSRKEVKGSIFFSLSGANFNGNAFATKALENGAAVAVIDDESFYVDNGKFVLVDDTLSFLQRLAVFHRSQFSCPVLAITGTNGKTTTKNLIAGTLSLKYKTYFTQGNLNNHIGVPLTLLSVDASDAKFVVVEMGANHPDEIRQLCEIADPDYGIITSIGKAHLEGFGNVETIIDTKTALYRHVAKKHGISFVNADSEVLMKNRPDCNVIFYGSGKGGQYVSCRGVNDTKSVNVAFDWRYETEQPCRVNSTMYGSYNYYNMLAAACVASYFSVDAQKINDYLNSYTASNNRSQIIGNDNVTIILDAYNANPSSVEAALDTFDKIESNEKIVVLGDMFELGDNTDVEHKNVVVRLKSMNLKCAILIGENYAKVADGSFLSFKATADAKDYLTENPIKNGVVLLKGSRGMMLEQLLDVLVAH